MSKKGLTTRQRRFVEAYEGNATEAARKAGYSASSDNVLAVAGYQLMRMPKIREAIDAREEGTLRKLVLNRDERQELWSEVAIDPKAPLKDRLRASELLGKSMGDFTERLEVKGELTLESLVLGSMKKPEGQKK